MHRGTLALSLGFLLACGEGGVESGDLSERSDPATGTGFDAGVRPKLDAGGSRADGGKALASTSRSRSDAGDDVCSSKTIPARAAPPDILIVLDKSLSMAPTRWFPSVAAVTDLTKKFQSVVSFGLSVFPHGQVGLCDPGTVDVPLKTNNADAIADFVGSTVPFGITPTGQTLQSALQALGDRNEVGDTPVTRAYVVLVTDGEPDCPDPSMPDPMQGVVDATTALMQANIKTYAIGYNLDPLGAQLMSDVATAGGTDHSFKVESPDDLNAAFEQITKDVVRCEFELDQVPDDPHFVLVEIDGKTVRLDPADGWVLEGKKITLMGGSCEMLKDGAQHTLNASIECTPILYL